MLISEPILAFVFVAILGLAVGSFLNVVIYRLPLMVIRQCNENAAIEANKNPSLSLALPASHCPHCKHALSLRDNIPLVSYVLLRGRCRFCQQAISARYPVVELLCAIVTVAIVHLYGFGWASVGGLILSWALIALAVIDLETGLLPDQLTLSLVWLGLLFSVNGYYVAADQAIIGVVLGYLSLWIINRGFKAIAKKDGLGYGDMKLTAALGGWIGWQSLPLLLLAASLVGLLVNLVALATGRIHGGQQIPFGPYLAAAGWLLFCSHDYFSTVLMNSLLPF